MPFQFATDTLQRAENRFRANPGVIFVSTLNRRLLSGNRDLQLSPNQFLIEWCII